MPSLVHASLLVMVCVSMSYSQIPALPPNPVTPLIPPVTKVAKPIRKIEFGVIATLPPDVEKQRLIPREKFDIYVHQNFGPQNLILPAFGAAAEMAHPPSGYPREWLDGGGAYGRWYGQQIAATTTNRSARLAGQILFHEDPRYVPSGSHNTFLRLGHALAFTLVDRSDGGSNMPAIANLMGATAGGFIGMAYFPPGHDDTRHAEQRTLRGLETIAVRNILTEFRPQWEPTLKRLNIPKILPAWWTRGPNP